GRSALGAPPTLSPTCSRVAPPPSPPPPCGAACSPGTCPCCRLLKRHLPPLPPPVESPPSAPSPACGGGNRSLHSFPSWRRGQRTGGRLTYPSGPPNRHVPMTVIESRLDPRSQEFRDNAQYHRALVEEPERRLARAADGGGEAARRKHTGRGKLLARDRITALLDPGSPFLEIAPLAAEDMYDGAAPAAGMVCGIGRVMGQEVVVVANDATVKGGTYFPMTVKKHLRAQEIARENRLPCVYLVDSGGAFLPLQDEVFPDKEHFGRIFYNQARMS